MIRYLYFEIGFSCISAVLFLNDFSGFKKEFNQIKMKTGKGKYTLKQCTVCSLLQRPNRGSNYDGGFVLMWFLLGKSAAAHMGLWGF